LIHGQNKSALSSLVSGSTSLTRFYLSFGLEQEAAIDGYIEVLNKNGQFHHFHLEEIFLFMMAK